MPVKCHVLRKDLSPIPQWHHFNFEHLSICSLRQTVDSPRSHCYCLVLKAFLKVWWQIHNCDIEAKLSEIHLVSELTIDFVLVQVRDLIWGKHKRSTSKCSKARHRFDYDINVILFCINKNGELVLFNVIQEDELVLGLAEGESRWSIRHSHCKIVIRIERLRIIKYYLDRVGPKKLEGFRIASNVL